MTVLLLLSLVAIVIHSAMTACPPQAIQKSYCDADYVFLATATNHEILREEAQHNIRITVTVHAVFKNDQGDSFLSPGNDVTVVASAFGIASGFRLREGVPTLLMGERVEGEDAVHINSCLRHSSWDELMESTKTYLQDGTFARHCECTVGYCDEYAINCDDRCPVTRFSPCYLEAVCHKGSDGVCTWRDQSHISQCLVDADKK